MFRELINALESSGYFVNWEVLNASDFGLLKIEKEYFVGTKLKPFNFSAIKKIILS